MKGEGESAHCDHGEMSFLYKLGFFADRRSRYGVLYDVSSNMDLEGRAAAAPSLVLLLLVC